jgi:hypothetical protein
MAGSKATVELNETQRDIEPEKRRDGIVVGEVRFSPRWRLDFF